MASPQLVQDHLETQIQSFRAQYDGYTRLSANLLHQIEQRKQNDQPYENEVAKLDALLNTKIRPMLATLRTFRQTYDESSEKSRSNFLQNRDIWSSTDEAEDTVSKLNEQQQQLNSAKLLVVQTRQQYLKQNTIMYMNIVLFVLLACLTGYLYYWLSTHTPSNGRSFANMPDNLKDMHDMFDNDFIDHADFEDDGHEEGDEEDDGGGEEDGGGGEDTQPTPSPSTRRQQQTGESKPIADDSSSSSSSSSSRSSRSARSSRSSNRDSNSDLFR
jgi:hypothetical protein